MSRQSWKIWVDTGGTFTDCMALSPAGEWLRLKVLSHGVLKGNVISPVDSRSIRVQLSWPVSSDIFHGFTFTVYRNGEKRNFRIERADLVESVVHLQQPAGFIHAGDVFEIGTGEEVPVFAARLITQTEWNKPFPPMEMKLGSTRGTNALLERKGANVAFLVTKGFKDLLAIGTQQRPDLFALKIEKPAPLYSQVFEVAERVDADGKLVVPLQQDELNRLIADVKNSGCESVAIALLNSYKNPVHENLLKEGFVRSGFPFISASHALSGQIKIIQRAETAVANAYLDPIIHQYLARIQEGLQQAQLKVMTSAGGLTNANAYYPKDSLLSGPAGGVVGAALAAARSGINQFISFDMGGTSTDVSLFNKDFTYRYESVVGDVKIFSPSLAIETIAAGGGSICHFDGHRLLVGPHSAGATPGPACYGSGGPLTITDVNLLLGRADETFFSIPLYRSRAEEALEQLLGKIKSATGKSPNREEILESLLQIANEKMAEAIRKVSLLYGHDPAHYTLLGFGGAGGQHACTLAGILNIPKVLIPYDAGLLSAYGIGHARIEHFEEQQVLLLFSKAEKSLTAVFNQLEKKGSKKLKSDGYPQKQIVRDKALLFLRFKGQESTIEVPYDGGRKILERFKKKYKTIYGHWLPDRNVEIESVRLVLRVKENRPAEKKKKSRAYTPVADKKSRMFIHGTWKPAAIYKWENLKPGAAIAGPALIVSRNSTTVVNEFWTFTLDEHYHGILKVGKRKAQTKTNRNVQAELELFSNRFTAVAQDMGALLQRTSFSVNVKERLDFSCALMDAGGYLVVNAPHIPVHLGSMGVCVRAVKKKRSLQPGDVIITNHPAYGGSHLPDITLIKPVYYRKKLIGYVANRAHHAEIGGVEPGSMPAYATALEEEGVIISPAYLVKKGNAQWHAVEKIFTGSRYPSRLPQENLADLNGALASVNLGEQALIELCRKYGAGRVQFYMKALRKYAARLLHEKMKTVEEKNFVAEEKLDDGSVLKVKITISRNQLTIDFTGSAPVHPGNMNATNAIVQSVILYVLRLWVNKPIAMNEGLLEPVKIILPEGLLSPDFSGEKLPAVVGGNTEVSQRLTDTMLKALGLVACSQGTMNNFLFGNERFGFYETICGGNGAGPGFNGADAVHTHMTNTRITDPEILELRYPVRLERFEIRAQSGGEGKWKGGNGAVREVLFKESAEVNILSQHRVTAPYGLRGGLPGKTGEQKLVKPDGRQIALKGIDSVRVEAGDKIVIATPGGGGFGKKP
jgi:5-oxoprolinase (ATP-hydrolysing)